MWDDYDKESENVDYDDDDDDWKRNQLKKTIFNFIWVKLGEFSRLYFVSFAQVFPFYSFLKRN
jgi:hypothetical protein